MKLTITLSCLILCLFFLGCKKDQVTSGTAVVSTPFLDSAKQYLRSTLSQNDFDNLDFVKSKAIIYKNHSLGVQVFEKGQDANKFLLLQYIGGNYSGNWVDLSGLAIKRADKITNGDLAIQSLDRKSATTITIEKNKIVNIIQTGNDFHHPDNVSPVLPEIIIYYDDYKGSNSDGGAEMFMSLYWLYNQNSFYSNYYYQSSTGGSAGGSGGGRPPDNNNTFAVPIYISPDNPITDLKKELGCFTNNSSSTYEISVNVNEPIPGSRDLVNPLSAFIVGHTYLTLVQNNADGSSIIRNVGFYPRNSVKPGSETDQSIFGDDGNTPYDVSLDFTVTGTEMARVIGRVLAQQAYQYDLNNFNCTNAAIDALQSININLPVTKSTEPYFNGNDPGDLGEDVRQLNLNDFSSQNGNRKITRTVSDKDNQYPKSKTGGC